jgi:hypothetical protein
MYRRFSPFPISNSALNLSTAEGSGVGSIPAFVPNGYVYEGDGDTTGYKEVLGYSMHLATLTGLGITNVATSGDALYQIDAAYAINVAPAFNASNRNTLIVISGASPV